MECDICSRSTSEYSDFLCTVCARTAAYLPRLKYAQILLEKADLVTKVENSISNDSQSRSTESEHAITGSKIWQSELKHVQITNIKEALNHSKVHRHDIQDECQRLRERIVELKAKIAEKRRVLERINKSNQVDRESYMTSLSAASNSISTILARLQQKSTSNRATLCREAASLMRLRQRHRQKDAQGSEQYSITGLALPDLREISHVRCIDLTAALDSVVRLVILVAFYLGIRLPAEIITLGPDRARPTIHLPSASYTGRSADTLYTEGTSTPASPSASKHEAGTYLKPRPLFIGTDEREERVFDYQKREPHTFNLFVEGVSLLAWNVAWLCRSQGFTVGTNSWEQICNIGKNLHQLLITHPQAPVLTRIQSERSLPRRPSQSRKISAVSEEARRDMTGKLAQYSDVSAVTSSHRSSHTDTMRSWEFSNWQAVALPLRRTLLTEIASADWELLKDQEWDDGGEQFDEAVFVKSRALDGQQYDDARSIMTTKLRLEDETAGRLPGTSGWTKVKSREK